VAQGVDPTTLDPMNHQETPAANLARNMFDTLLERDENLVIQPALAVALPRLVAPTVWEFKLRPGVKSHNGEPLDAAAGKFSLERLVDPKLKLRGATPFAPISHVEVVDPLTVRIHTKAPWPILDTLVAENGASILPPKYYREKDPAHVARNPVGSDPFKPIPDDAVRVAALQNGEIDIAVNIPPHLAAIIANHPRLFLSTAPSVRTIQLLYYTHQFDAQHKLGGPYAGPVADRRVRVAMNHAVDVDEVIRSVLDGRGIRVHHADRSPLRVRSQAQSDQAGPCAHAAAPLRSGLPERARDGAQRPPGSLRARQGSGSRPTFESIGSGWTPPRGCRSTSSSISTGRPGAWPGRRTATRPSRASRWP